MGTTYVSIEGRSGSFNDTDLLVVLRLATNAMRNQESLAEFAEALEGTIQGHGPGVVDIPVDSLAGERDQLSALLLGLRAEVQSFGDAMPLAYLRERCDIPGIRFESAYPTRLLVVAIERLRGLLEPGTP